MFHCYLSMMVLSLFSEHQMSINEKFQNISDTGIRIEQAKKYTNEEKKIISKIGIFFLTLTF